MLPPYLRSLLPRHIHVLLSLRVPEFPLLRISLCCCHEHVLTRSLYEYYLAAKEREKEQKLASQKKVAEAQAANRAMSPTQKVPKAAKSPKKTGTASGAATPKRKGSDSTALEQRNIDVSALGLGVEEKSPVQEEPPRMALAREKALEEAMKALEAESKGQAGISLVVIGESNI